MVFLHLGWLSPGVDMSGIHPAGHVKVGMSDEQETRHGAHTGSVQNVAAVYPSLKETPPTKLL